ncbi:unnamed protein product [Dovyalis caffra]|uniref:Uncharacterized protein n=1 Tax=Dovyalis caffra TaxID=77055 RepID=A0AAV1QSC2_9ROSI|nr:unnamed protein product [Dovyalis caffra]
MRTGWGNKTKTQELLPYEYGDGNPVPTIIFKDLPSTFHAYVISIIFAFTGSFSSLLIRDKVKYAKYEKFSRFYSLVFMVFAVAILVYAVSLSCLVTGDEKMQVVPA